MHLWAHQRAIADSIGAPDVERVSVLKSARVGHSSLISAAIGYHVAVDPAPILCVLPTESDCRGYLVDDVESTFLASPALCGKLKPPSRTPDERSTLLHRFFDGGSLKITSAQAPRNLRRHRSESLDCAVYGLAARAALSLDLDRREQELGQVARAPERRPSVIKSEWISR